jgi:hypothetical protein
MVSADEVREIERLFGKRTGSVEAPHAPRIIVLPLAPLAVAPLSEGQCCGMAERVPCVCRVSWKCAAHGARCIGSHD